jgi:hypothetical protein
MVFVVGADDEFLERLRDEECTYDELEAFAESESALCLNTTTESDVDVHHLLSILGANWSESVDVEDLDGAVKLLSPRVVEGALERLEKNLAEPAQAAQRLASILAEEFSAESDESGIERAAATFAELDARAEPEDDGDIDAAAAVLVQHLHALRTACEHDLWLVTASYMP